MRGYLRLVGRASGAMKLFIAYTLLANIGLGVFQLIYNLYLVRIGYHEDFIGALTAVNTVAIALMALAMGPLINRFGSWACILAGTVMVILSLFGQAALTGAPLLLISAAIGGIGQAGLIVPNMPFIIEHTRDDERPDLSALTFSIMALSMTFGALVGGRLPDLLKLASAAFTDESVATYRATLLAGAILTVAALLPLLLIRDRNPGRAMHAGALGEGGPVTRRVRNDMAVFVAVGALYSVSAAAIVPFYNVYLRDLGAEPSLIGTIFALSGVVGAVLGICAPALARRYGVLPVAASARFAGVPFLLLLVFIPGLNLAFIAYFVRSAAMSMTWPLDSNLIAEVLPHRQRATVFSFRSAAWNSSWAIASFVIGQLIVATGGYNVVFISSVLFASLALVIFTGYFSRHPHVIAQQAKRRAPAVERRDETAAPVASSQS